MVDKIPQSPKNINSIGDGCPEDFNVPRRPKTTPEIILETSKDIAKTLGILVVVLPKVIGESGIFELIDPVFKIDNCRKTEEKNEKTRNPDSSIYKVEKTLKDGINNVKSILSPVSGLLVDKQPIKKNIEALLYLLNYEPCYFIDQLKITLITPGGNQAFVIRHFMAKLKKIVNYLKESSNEELEEKDNKKDAGKKAGESKEGESKAGKTNAEESKAGESKEGEKNEESDTKDILLTALKKALDIGQNDLTENDKELAKQNLESIKKKKEEIEKCGTDTVAEFNKALSEILGYGEEYTNKFLIATDLIKKPNIYKLFLNLDIIFANYLKKPEDTGKQKHDIQQNIFMTTEYDLCENASYEECLKIGCDKTYDANNNSTSNITTAGIGKSFVDLGIEKFDYKYEDVCFVVDKEKLEILIKNNKELKLMLIYLLEELTLYNVLSDKSLEEYMESALTGNELTENEKKNKKNLEDKDIKRATEKEDTLKKDIKRATEQEETLKKELKIGGGMNYKKTNKKTNKKTIK